MAVILAGVLHPREFVEKRPFKPNADHAVGAGGVSHVSGRIVFRALYAAGLIVIAIMRVKTDQ